MVDERAGVVARTVLPSLLLAAVALLSLVLIAMNCLWRRQKRAKLEGKEESIPGSPGPQETERANTMYVESDDQPAYTVNAATSDASTEDKVEMRNKHTTQDSPSCSSPKSKTSPPNVKQNKSKNVFNKMFKSKKYLDVEPAPDYLSSRRDTLQHERSWHRKYSAQWHDFVENELLNMPAQIKTQSQLQLVENPA